MIDKHVRMVVMDDAELVEQGKKERCDRLFAMGTGSAEAVVAYRARVAVTKQKKTTKSEAEATERADALARE